MKDEQLAIPTLVVTSVILEQDGQSQLSCLVQSQFSCLVQAVSVQQ